MPVAQLVNLFETMDLFLADFTYSDRNGSSKASSVSLGKRLSLKTMFKSHTRGSSASSGTTTTTVSGAASPSTPVFANISSEFLPAFAPTLSLQHGHLDEEEDFSLACVFPEPRQQMHVSSLMKRDTFSSTSAALQSESKTDLSQGAGLDLFEPRPLSMMAQGRWVPAPLVLDGIMQVMESG